MTTYFAASYSTLDARALATLVSEAYGLHAINCRLLTRGVGDTYLIESPTSRFILRVYRSSHRKLPDIETETALLLALKAADVPVSYPIADGSGKLIQTLHAIEGDRYAVLFTYAPGRSLSALNDVQLRTLGHQMARFHNVSSTIANNHTRWTIDLKTTLFDPLKIVEPLYADNSADLAWWQQTAERVEKKLSRLNTDAFSTGYCHYDFLPKNFHFEGDSITFFDFDFLGYGWLSNDIMTFWLHLCLETHFGRMTQDTANKAYALFIAAYREYRPFSEEELAAVPWLCPGFWLYGTVFHSTHDQFYAFIQPAHLKLRTGLVRQLFDRYCAL